MRSVPNATVQRGPVVRSVPEAVVEVDPEITPRRRLKPTELKLPATITDELRSAMIWLRANGEWDASMSQIAQAGIRQELDRLKKQPWAEKLRPTGEQCDWVALLPYRSRPGRDLPGI